VSPAVRILFAGSDDFSHTIAKRLLEAGEEVVGVLTAPDKPRGRSLTLRPVPFAEEMEKAGLRVLKLQDPKSPLAVEAVKATDANVLVLASYGKIIPGSLLQHFEGNTLNVHPSLLPKYRGAAPVQRALMDGVRETGVTIIQMVERMDAGPIFAAQAFEVGPNETAGEILGRAADIGATLLLSLLARLHRGEVLEGKPQDESAATYAPRIKPEERWIHWNHPAERIHNLVRALNPNPVARTSCQGEQLRILRTRIANTDAVGGLRPGAIKVIGDRVFGGTGTSAIELLEVQREGRRPMSAREWAHGARLPADARFEF
jgi:methionyl-tRNA formyltransferase